MECDGAKVRQTPALKKPLKGADRGRGSERKTNYVGTERGAGLADLRSPYSNPTNRASAECASGGKPNEKDNHQKQPLRRRSSSVPFAD